MKLVVSTDAQMISEEQMERYFTDPSVEEVAAFILELMIQVECFSVTFCGEIQHIVWNILISHNHFSYVA